MAIIPKNYARLESGYREKSIKKYIRGSAVAVPASLFIPTCVNLLFTTLITTIPITRKMAVTGNCFVSIATIMSIRNIPKRISMVRPLSQGEDAQKDVGEAKYNPFADLKAMMNKKK